MGLTFVFLFHSFMGINNITLELYNHKLTILQSQANKETQVLTLNSSMNMRHRKGVV